MLKKSYLCFTRKTTLILLMLAALAAALFAFLPEARRTEAAASDWQNTRVGGVALTSGTYYKQTSASAISADGASASDYNVHFDATTNTLTLKDLGKETEFTGTQTGWPSSNIYFVPKTGGTSNLNIVVLGTNKMKSSVTDGFSIHTGNTDVGTVNIVIGGGGSLTISAVYSAFYCSGDLTIKDGTTLSVEATGSKDVGIKTEKNLYVMSGAKVTSKGGNFGIYVNAGLYVDRLSSLRAIGSVCAFLGKTNMSYNPDVILDPSTYIFENTTSSTINYLNKTGYRVIKTVKGATTGATDVTIRNLNAGTGITVPSAPASATVSSAEIHGVRNGSISTNSANNSVVVTLSNAEFVTPISDSVARSFFTNIPSGVSVSGAMVSGSNNQKMKFTFSGTPTASRNAAMTIKIGKEYNLSAAVGSAAKDLTVASNSEAKWRIAPEPTASIDDITVEGVINSPLTEVSTVVKLFGATFYDLSSYGTNVNSWFTGLPSGINVTAKPLSDTTTASLTFKGTPTVLSSAAMSLTVSASKMKTSDVGNTAAVPAAKVSLNNNAKFSITEPAIQIEDVTVTGTAGYALGENKVVLNALGVKFADTFSGDVTPYFSGLPAGITVNAAPLDGFENKVELSFGGTAGATSAVIALTVPSDQLKTLSGGSVSSSITVTENLNAKFDVSEPSAAVSNLTVYGTAGSGVSAQALVITLSYLAFDPDMDTDFTAFFTNLPAGMTATAAIVDGSGNKQARVTFGGKPSAAFDETMSVTVGKECLLSLGGEAFGEDLVPAKNVNALFSIIGAPSAVLGDIILYGTAGNAIADGQTATLTLSNAKFNNIPADVTAMFTGLPAGITVSASTVAGSGDKQLLFSFSGTPAAASTANITVTVPAANLVPERGMDLSVIETTVTGSSDSAVCSIAPAPRLAGADKNVTAVLNKEFTAEIELTFANVRVNESALPADIAAYITNLPAGMTAAWVLSGAVMTVTLTGTPTAELSQAVAVTFPASVLLPHSESDPGTIQNALEMATNSNLRFNFMSAGASISSVTVYGTVGNAIAETEAVVTLVGLTFSGLPSNVSGFFTGLPAGISVSAAIVAGSGDAQAKLVFSGTPAAAFEGVIGLTIPKEYLRQDGAVYSEDMTVGANPDTGFLFCGAPALTIGDIAVEGSALSAITAKTVELTLVNARFKDFTGDVTVLFTGLPAGITVTAAAVAGSNGTRATLSFAGTPAAAASGKLTLTVTAAYLQPSLAADPGTISASVALTENSSAIIDISPAPVLTIGDVSVNGMLGAALVSVTAELTLTNATFKSNLPASALGFLTESPEGIAVAIETVAGSGGARVRLIFSGTPASVLSGGIALSISGEFLAPVKGDAGIDNAVVLTANSAAVWNITGAPAVELTDVTLNGTQGSPITTTTARLVLTNALFTGLPANASEFLTNIPAGISVQMTLAADKKSATLSFSGTPAAALNANIAFTVSKAYLSPLYGGELLLEPTAAPNASAVWNIVGTPVVELSELYYEDGDGNPLDNPEAYLTIENAKFEDVPEDITDMFDGLPEGVRVKTELIDDQTIKIVFEGSPKKTTETDSIEIVISKDVISAIAGDAPISHDLSFKLEGRFVWEKKGLTAGAIVGIVLGAVAVAAAAGFVFLWWFFVLRRKKEVEETAEPVPATETPAANIENPPEDGKE